MSLKPVDAHALTAISADFIRIKLFTTRILNVGIGKVPFRLTIFSSDANDSLQSPTLGCNYEGRSSPAP